MSFHADVVAALKTDLVSAGITDDERFVYAGRRPRELTAPTREVWIQRAGTDQRGAGSAGVEHHPYLLHVISRKGTRGADRAGRPDLDEVETLAEEIARRYHGTRPFIAAIPDIVVVSAIEEDMPEEDDDPAVATVRVVFVVETDAGVVVPVPPISGPGVGFGAEWGEMEFGE